MAGMRNPSPVRPTFAKALLSVSTVIRKIRCIGSATVDGCINRDYFFVAVKKFNGDGYTNSQKGAFR
jgi:hypothetical protein